MAQTKEQRHEYYLRNKARIIARNKEWKSRNKDKVAAQSVRYRKKHPDAAKAASASWQKRNPDKCRAYSEKYRKLHPGAAYASSRKWILANPEKHRQMMRPLAVKYNHQRRAMEKSRPYDKSIDMKSLGDRDGWTCHICGEPAPESYSEKHLRPTIDHILPISRGGSHTWDNVKTAHLGCNQRKNCKVIPCRVS